MHYVHVSNFKGCDDVQDRQTVTGKIVDRIINVKILHRGGNRGITKSTSRLSVKNTGSNGNRGLKERMGKWSI